jgi:D-amino-acid dehydrogenase
MEPDVVVVGGGAIGASAAYELARRGLRATLVERGDLAAECSSGNAGLLCPGHSQPLATPSALRDGVRSLHLAGGTLGLRPRLDTLGWLARFAAASRAGRAERGTDVIRALSVASLFLHAELAGLGTSFERRGILNVYLSEEGLAAGRREVERSGLAARALSADEARAIEPAARGAIAGGFFFPDEAHLDPHRYVEAVGAAAAAAGADVLTGHEVRALRRRNGGIDVETARGTLRPATVVLAAGVWSGPLARGLGVFVPVTGGKGYHVDLAPAPGDPRIPILIHGARSAITPLPDRLRLTGTLEVSGLDARPSGERLEAVRRAAARVLGDEPRETVDVWTGLRPCMPDGLPVIGRPASLPSLVLATGHAMKGLSLAPVTGLLVGELLEGAPPSHDLAPLSPDRFRPLFRR